MSDSLPCSRAYQLSEIQRKVDLIGSRFFPELDLMSRRCLVVQSFIPSLKMEISELSESAFIARCRRTRLKMGLSKEELQTHILEKVFLSIEQAQERPEPCNKFPLSKMLKKR